MLMNIVARIFIKIGHIIIICFGVVYYWVKRLVNVIRRKGDKESVFDFVERLENKLNEYTSPNPVPRGHKRGKPYMKAYPQGARYNVQKKSLREAKPTKKEQKGKDKKRVLASFFTPKRMAYIAAATCALVALVFIGSAIAKGSATKTPDGQIMAAKGEEESQDKSLAAPSATPDPANQETEAMNDPEATENSDGNGSSVDTVPDALANTEVASATVTPTTAPTPSPTPNTVEDGLLIHFKDTHDEIYKIQERLMELHYMDEDEPTNYYGPVTEFAIQLFQRGHKLSVDGVIGANTVRLLYSEDAKPYTVRKGDKGKDITQIQKRLSELGYLKSKDRDDRFDKDTDKAVREFQGRNKLSQDGIVGYYTTQVLFNEDAKPAKTYTKPDNSDDSDDGETYEGNPSASKLVKYAKSLKGKGIPYVWGGKTLKGLDCSGYVYYCLNHSGYKTGYRTSSAWATSGYTTISSMSKLKVGDIVCFEGHVGIYIGSGKMIDCSSSQNGIRITNIKTSSYWNRKFVCGKRVFD